jgi:hypothetical protein
MTSPDSLSKIDSTFLSPLLRVGLSTALFGELIFVPFKFRGPPQLPPNMFLSDEEECLYLILKD